MEGKQHSTGEAHQLIEKLQGYVAQQTKTQSQHDMRIAQVTVKTHYDSEAVRTTRLHAATTQNLRESLTECREHAKHATATRALTHEMRLRL